MKKNRGFSLLEVMVTLVIVSLGLLGVAGLIANSLKYNQSAYARTQATWFANEIIDQMRANRTTATGAAHPYDIAKGAAAPTGTSIPETDVRNWLAEIQASLPSGKASIESNKPSAGMVTVTIDWDDSSRLATGAVVTGSGTLAIETRL
ncbi:MAG: type IV pilus modification protein PilV [Bacteroidota bacterium]